jgi:hypothetical protein
MLEEPLSEVLTEPMNAVDAFMTRPRKTLKTTNRTSETARTVTGPQRQSSGATR